MKYNPFKMWGSYVGSVLFTVLAYFSSKRCVGADGQGGFLNCSYWIETQINFIRANCPGISQGSYLGGSGGDTIGCGIYNYIEIIIPIVLVLVIGFIIGWIIHSLFRRFKK